ASHHRSVFLRGLPVPGARRLLHHDYPVTPGVVRALRRARPDVVVVSGWSTFASQAAIGWCRAHSIPYVLLVESHDLGRRSAWRGDGVVVISVARLAREKGLDTLVRAVAATRDPRAAIVVAGSGPQASTLMQLADGLGVRLLLTGELSEERVAELYAAADVFA